MNTAFVNIITRIVKQQGEAVLGDPARLKRFVHKDARTISAELRLAFGHCIEQGYYSVLKQAVADGERSRVKPQIARQIHNISKLEEAICAEAVDVLEAVLYGLRPANTATSTVQGRKFPPHLSRLSRRGKIVLIAGSTAVVLVILLIVALVLPVTAFKPIVEFNDEAYPSKIIATVAVSSVLGGGPRMIETGDYIGDALGDFGVKLRSALPAAVVRIEIEGDYLIKKSDLETRIDTQKSVEIFPRINYNFTELENLREQRIENVSFRLYVNDKLKKEKIMAVPFHAIDDEPCGTRYAECQQNP
jgi:hypothetical protein